jgi:hypothetical protein
VMRRTKWPIASGKDALKIKGIGQGMADRVYLLDTCEYMWIELMVD